MENKPRTLIMGHSFVRRFKHFVTTPTDKRVALDLSLREKCQVHIHGIGGRTISKLIKFDLGQIQAIKPQLIVLELGTNDLSNPKISPDALAAEMISLVNLLHYEFHVNFIIVCQIINRNSSNVIFNESVLLYNVALTNLTKPLKFAYLWKHKGLIHPTKSILARDGVHLNKAGEYILYRSYRGAILFGLKQIFN